MVVDSGGTKPSTNTLLLYSEVRGEEPDFLELTKSNSHNKKVT